MPSPVASHSLRLSVASGIATMTIDNEARRNAIDFATWRAFPQVMATLGADDNVRVVIIRGAGDVAFTAGADIGEFGSLRASPEGGRAYEAANLAAFEAVAACPKPVLALIRGFCLGGGLGIALACDLRIAADDAVFAIPAARLGVGYPPAGMGMIVAAIGAAAAKDLIFTARRIEAAEALTLGLVQKVVPAGDIERAAAGLAETIAVNAPLTIRAAKAAVATAAGLPGAGTPNDLQALADACFASADYAEGCAAFLGKRSPQFTGR
ncbi:Enoyl-CoA hydratase/carnithine racemase [Chelatococcus sambhunathii]|uniref:Enoyl-CoA hydratase/carnithine racemase n=1 Tax=Chelatococcus sambhunathii TaxID=363953 RepID=A0ABM9TWR6_9HYPH|nr:enoyl-CoA hydratase [Chelatococcus sambhunathii]CUA83789.1 Enoyl-CoA hydratase/carnithine racemase [Chelatococcus sambhunathii]